MKNKFRKDWMLGFLGLFSLYGFRYLQTKEWFYLVWFTWVVWFTWFIPLKK
jgi:hypothetical protein